MIQELFSVVQEILTEGRKPNVKDIDKRKHEEEVKAVLTKNKAEDEEPEPSDADIKSASIEEKPKTKEEVAQDLHKKRIANTRAYLAKHGVKGESGNWELPSGSTPEDLEAKRRSKIETPERDPEAQSKLAQKRKEELDAAEEKSETKANVRAAAADDYPGISKKILATRSAKSKELYKTILKAKNIASAQQELSPVLSKMDDLQQVIKTKDLHKEAEKIRATPPEKRTEPEDVQVMRQAITRARQKKMNSKVAPSDKPKTDKATTDKTKYEYGSMFGRIRNKLKKIKADQDEMASSK